MQLLAREEELSDAERAHFSSHLWHSLPPDETPRAVLAAMTNAAATDRKRVENMLANYDAEKEAEELR